MAMKLRSAFVLAMIWLLTVAGVSATAWVAIDRAGHDISGADPSSQVTPSLGPTFDTTTLGATPTSTTTTTRPSASTSTAMPTSKANPWTPPPPKPSPAPARTPTARDRTVIVAGGRVSVRCVGANITLRIAQPDDGWRVEVDAERAGQVGVTFQRGDEEAGARTHVSTVCRAGTPAFTVSKGG
jgi:hypothetical protein